MLARLPVGRPFDDIAQAVHDFHWRPEVAIVEIDAPLRLSPYALAIEATVSGDIAAGRLVVLHDPDGVDAWGGQTRLVSYTRAQIEFEMAVDPLLSDVAWSWLTDALRHASAAAIATSGTVTTMTSRAFGELDGRPTSAELEVRCSWTPGDDSQIDRHMFAWQELICQMGGLEPLVEGVIPLGRRAE